MALTTRKTTNAISKKLITAWIKLPYSTVASPTWIDSDVKSTPPMMMPISGITMSLTSEVTMPVNAAPMITATAKSMTLPRLMNARNSFNIILL